MPRNETSKASVQGSDGAALASDMALENWFFQKISTHELSPGDKLPTERELADQFGCSRATVRKALDRLEYQGSVKRKIGSGTFVSKTPFCASFEASINPRELTECRLAIEPFAAKLAVMNATHLDIRRLEGIYEQMSREGICSERFSELDKSFHFEIIKLSRNPLFIELYERLNRIRELQEWEEVKRRLLNAGTIRAYNSGHREILDAMRAREPQAVATAMHEHLSLIELDVRKS